jgi:acetyl esterase
MDPQVTAWLERARELGVPAYHEVSLAEARRLADEGGPALFGEPDPVRSVEDADSDGVPVRVYRPEEGDLPALVYFHGGGWVVGSLDSHDALCRTLAARSGCALVAVDYRLAPEHRFPAALEDAWTATPWAAQRCPRLAVGGDSAGGTLAAVVALRARDRGLPLALQVLVYAATDFSFDTDSYREHGTGTNLTEEGMRWFWAQYLPDDAAGADPEASPLRAGDLAGVAPALVITAEYDPLRDEGEAYARALGAAGVPVTLTRYPGMIHAFFRFTHVMDAARAAVAEVVAALQKAWGTTR